MTQYMLSIELNTIGSAIKTTALNSNRPPTHLMKGGGVAL